MKSINYFTGLDTAELESIQRYMTEKTVNKGEIFLILPDKCVGCGLCLRNCAVGAIWGNKKEPHRIDPEKCVRCGLCISSCRAGAIKVD